MLQINNTDIWNSKNPEILTLANLTIYYGFFIAALVAVKEFDLAEKKLLALTKLVQTARNKELEYGLNEWIRTKPENQCDRIGKPGPLQSSYVQPNAWNKKELSFLKS